MRTSSKHSALIALAALAGVLFIPGPARAVDVVYDFLSPEATALGGLVSATYEVDGVPLEIQAGLLDQAGNFIPGGADATLAVILEPPPFHPGMGLGVLSSILSGSSEEQALSREEGLFFRFSPVFSPTRFTLSGFTLGGPEGGGTFEGVRIFVDGAFFRDLPGEPDGTVTIPLPAGVSTLALTPLLEPGPEVPQLSSDPTIFVASIEGAVAGVEVAFDLKPGSCTNPLQTDSRGVLPAAILGTPNLDATSIDPASVRVAGVAPLRSGIADVGAPFEPFTGRQAGDCIPAGPDGIPDLTLKFSTQEIVQALRAALGTLRDRQVVVLPLEARLFDGTPVVGEDLALILVPGRERNRSR